MAAFSAPILVGRTEELSEISELLAAARGGQGRLAVVAGEAGVGKTRLVRAIQEQAEGLGARVLWGDCLEQYRSLPYGPIADALRRLIRGRSPDDARELLGSPDRRVLRLVPELDPEEREAEDPGAAESELERHRLAQALGALLERQADERPLLLVVEDLRWADAATLDLIPMLVHRSARAASSSSRRTAATSSTSAPTSRTRSWS